MSGEHQKLEMKMKLSARFTLLAFTLTFLAACASGPTVPASHKLVESARQTVENLKARKDLEEFNPMLKTAVGVAVFPTVYKAGFVIGAEMGNGVILARKSDGSWGYPAFYTMGAGSVGLQAGAQQAEIVFIIRSTKALQAVIKHQGKFGADAGIAIGHLGSGVEGSVTSNLGLDMVAFTGAKGLFGGGSLEGAAIIRRNDYNKEYYGTEATPADIVLKGNQRNSQADRLRAALMVR